MAITRPPKRFLSIDDDRTLQMIVKQILTKSFGAETLEVFQASTGEEGLQVMREIKPDIILCDIHMPGMDGFEVCRNVRELKLRSAVILMSAYDAEQDNAIKASETGADAYLSKPLKKGELLCLCRGNMLTKNKKLLLKVGDAYSHQTDLTPSTSGFLIDAPVLILKVKGTALDSNKK